MDILAERLLRAGLALQVAALEISDQKINYAHAMEGVRRAMNEANETLVLIQNRQSKK